MTGNRKTSQYRVRGVNKNRTRKSGPLPKPPKRKVADVVTREDFLRGVKPTPEDERPF